MCAFTVTSYFPHLAFWVCFLILLFLTINVISEDLRQQKKEVKKANFSSSRLISFYSLGYTNLS